MTLGHSKSLHPMTDLHGAVKCLDPFVLTQVNSEGLCRPELPLWWAEAFFGVALHLTFALCSILPPSLPPIGVDCKTASY